MFEFLSNDEQSITIFKINPNQQELNGDVDFGRNVNGRNLYGKLAIKDNCLIVFSEYDDIIGIYSLDHFYFLNTNS